MLHHVPTPALQDRLFAEACRVLRPGGVFAGSDGQPSLRFRLIHLGDTLVPVSAETLPARLTAAGFTDVRVERVPGRVHFTPADRLNCTCPARHHRDTRHVRALIRLLRG